MIAAKFGRVLDIPSLATKTEIQVRRQCEVTVGACIDFGGEFISKLALAQLREVPKIEVRS